MAESFPMPFGRYQLVERLAVGGMAELFKAQVSGAHGFSKQVVIKRILPYLAGDEHYNTMFIDEAKITARLAHPKIAQTLELGKFNGQLYIAMEYVDGLDVLAMLRECAHRRTKIPLPVAVHLIQDVLDALDFAHQQTDADGKPLNIVHRDISPSNILVSRRGDVKLIDFGIAQAEERDQNTSTGTLKGKYGYMAPEQVVGGGVDSRSDLFSAAIVLAEMAMGRRLFVAPNELDVLLMVRDVRLERLAKYGKDLDPDLDRLLRKALAKDPDERFQTGAELRDELGEWMFDKKHRVTAAEVAVLVNDLYDDAWRRKRAAPVEPPRPPVQEVAAVAAAAERSHELGYAVTDPGATGGSAPREFPTSASMEEAIAFVAGEQEGIPVGLENGSLESAPVVLVEQSSSSRIPAVQATVDSGDIDIPIFEADSGPTTKENQYDIGELGAELSLGGDEPVPATAGGAIEEDFNTEEIAFDDIVAAVESSIPKDQTGKAVQPSPEEIEQARALRPSVAEIDDEPDDRGELAETPPLRVLYRLAVARASGLLRVGVGGIRKDIFLEDGRPTYVSSNVRSELFGEYLIAQRALSDGELSMALAMMPHYGGKLGDTLVGLGLMKPLDVFRHLSHQVRDKLIDVCTWNKGKFEWYEGKRNEREAFPLDLDSLEVLGAGALAISRDRIDAWAAGASSITYRSIKGDVAPESFQLGSFVRDVYNALDGTHTLGELLARFDDRDERMRFCRAAYLLVMTELAQPQT